MTYFFILIWILLSFLAAYLAKDKPLGFSRTLLLGLVLSPIVGFVLPHAFVEQIEERKTAIAEGRLKERICAHCGYVERKERFDSLVCPMCRHNVETGQWTWHVLLNLGLYGGGNRYWMFRDTDLPLGEGEKSPKTYPKSSPKVWKRVIAESGATIGGRLRALFFIFLFFPGLTLVFSFPTSYGLFIGLIMLALAAYILWEKFRIAQKNIYRDGLQNQEKQEGKGP